MLPMLLLLSDTLVTELAFPAERASLETITRAASVVGRFDGQVIVLSDDKSFAVVAAFDEAGASREAVFGKLTDQARRPLGKSVGPEPAWRAVDVVGNKALLFDGAALSFVEVDSETLAEVGHRSVPWDQLRPPRDRGGEAPGWETAALRARFQKALQATPGAKVAGLARIPAAWRGKGASGRGYFATTRIKGFPLLELECGNEESPSACFLSRACNVENFGDIVSDDIVGAGTLERGGERLVLIGDASRRRIVGLDYKSCFHVPRSKREWIVPAKVKSLTTFAVDAGGILWVGSHLPDDYLNASVYFWAPGSW